MLNSQNFEQISDDFEWRLKDSLTKQTELLSPLHLYIVKMI